MAGTGRVLIVGGGVGGMSCAISLRRAGISVDLVEIDPTWKIYGAGITITGPTLRALQTLGVLDEVTQHGATWEGAYVYSQTGQLIEELNYPPIAADLPGTGGIMRPELHKILSTTTLAAGVHVRLGTTVETLSQVPGGVEVKLTNGHREQYSLVVGADGIYSKMRERVFPQAPRPKFTGQVIYRIVAERPPGFDRTHFYMGPDSKLGFNPVSRTHMYMFLLQRSPSNPWIAVEDGIVLAEAVTRDADIDAALPRFMKRRYERGKLVVENSLRLGELEMTHGSPKEHSRVMMAAVAALAQPA